MSTAGMFLHERLAYCDLTRHISVTINRSLNPSCPVRVFCKHSETTPLKGATAVSDEGSYTYVPNFQAILSFKEPDHFNTSTMFTYVTNYTSRSSFVSYGGLSRSMPADYLTNSHCHMLLAKTPEAPFSLASVLP